MALIKCPECGKEISNKSNQCIHCGYPINSNIIIINGSSYDASIIYQAIDDYKHQLIDENKVYQIVTTEILKYNLSYKDTNILSDQIIENGKIPQYYNGLTRQEEVLLPNTPKCPTCGSTNIKKISGISKAGSVAMFGLLSRKVHKQWHCNNCGSEW